MTDKDAAIERLLEIAKGHIETVDGEWGCCHDFNEALENSYQGETINCPMHDDAVEIAELEAVLRA